MALKNEPRFSLFLSPSDDRINKLRLFIFHCVTLKTAPRKPQPKISWLKSPSLPFYVKAFTVASKLRCFKLTNQRLAKP